MVIKMPNPFLKEQSNYRIVILGYQPRQANLLRQNFYNLIIARSTCMRTNLGN